MYHLGRGIDAIVAPGVNGLVPNINVHYLDAFPTLGILMELVKMSKGRIYKKMPKNYYNYFDICKWEGIPTGTAKRAIGGNGLEGILSVEVLKPIAHQFKEFPKYENGTLRSQYGILKTNYDFYKKNGRARKQSPGRPPRWKDNPNVVNINIPCPADLYEEFKTVVDNANEMSVVKVAYRDMIYVALREFIDRRPNLK